MSVQINGLKSSMDFTEKIKREVWRLHEAQFEDVYENILDHGLNAVITAWHIHEVIAKEKKISINQYRNDIKKRCEYLGILHDIATQVKHLQVTRPLRSNSSVALNMNSNTRSFMTEEEWEVGQSFLAECGVRFANQRYEQIDYNVLIVDGIELMEILEEVCKFWQGEIAY